MFTSGFFNSINSDRKYNAEQMAAIFDGLITDGIFDSIGDHFQVTPASSGLGVNIGTGRAWLNQTWSYNDTAYPVTLGAASSSLGRKDLICLKVDKSNAVRANSLVVIAGTPAASPVEPTVTDDTTNGIYYHKLAAVTIPKGATSISAANITNYIGLSTGTPYVTGILSSTAVDELWSQWDGEFNDWWDDIKATLDDNVVTTILNKIDHITPKEATMNLYGFSHINPPPSGKTYAEYSTDAILNQISSLLNNVDGVTVGDIVISTSKKDSAKYAVAENINTDSGTDTRSFVIAPYDSDLEETISDESIYGYSDNLTLKAGSRFPNSNVQILKNYEYDGISYDFVSVVTIANGAAYCYYRNTINDNMRYTVLLRYDLNSGNIIVINPLSVSYSYKQPYYVWPVSNAILLWQLYPTSSSASKVNVFLSYDNGLTFNQIGSYFDFDLSNRYPVPALVIVRGNWVYPICYAIGVDDKSYLAYVPINIQTRSLGTMRKNKVDYYSSRNPGYILCANGNNVALIQYYVANYDLHINMNGITLSGDEEPTTFDGSQSIDKASYSNYAYRCFTYLNSNGILRFAVWTNYSRKLYIYAIEASMSLLYTVSLPSGAGDEYKYSPLGTQLRAGKMALRYYSGTAFSNYFVLEDNNEIYAITSNSYEEKGLQNIGSAALNGFCVEDTGKDLQEHFENRGTIIVRKPKIVAAIDGVPAQFLWLKHTT